MRSVIQSLSVLVLIFVLVIGCSSGSHKSPVVPADEENENIPQNETVVSQDIEFTMLDDTFHSLGTIGKWELVLDEESMTVELVSARTLSIGESYIVSGASFFTIQPCSDCLQVKSMQMTSEGYLQIAFSASHPFKKGNTSLPPSPTNRLDLDVFDLALFVVPSSADLTNFALTGIRAYANICVKADGYTRELSGLTHKYEACPYFLVVDNSDGGSSNNNRFAMGTNNVPFNAFFATTGRFDLYLTMGYGASARKKTRLTPVYYIPEFNRKSAWKVEVIPPQGDSPPDKGNTWDDHDTSTEYEITVKVWDWQQKAVVASNYPDPSHPNYIYKASKVARLSLDIPGMFNALKYVTTASSGDGSPLNPLVYIFMVANENSLEEGEYLGLVKVSDERLPPSLITPGQTDSLVHSPDGATLYWYSIQEFVTYQVFKATVVASEKIIVTYPNGGEDWNVGDPVTITWNTVGILTTNVNIDFSLDSGVNYAESIASDIVNTGSFDVASLGNWPTEHARIRVSNSSDPTISDQSDGDFTLACSGVLPPDNVNATDGTYYDKVRVTWDAVIGATGYNIYKNNVIVRENYQTLLWDDTSVSPGVVYNYQLQTKQGSCLSWKSSNEPGNTCVRPGAPSGLTASDGAYSDRVALSWTSGSGAASYNIYRDSIQIQTGVTDTSYIDTTVNRGVIYTYEVESQNACGVSASKSSPNTGYAFGCATDTNNSCTDATKTNLKGSVTGCVDQIDEDWYFFYVSPNGFTSSSAINLTIGLGTVDVTVYGTDPGTTCPGTQLHSVTNVGTGSITMPSGSDKSRIYVKINGNSGMVNYTMQMSFVAALTNLDIEIYVATTTGTEQGIWPTGATQLTHNTLLNMVLWANNWWNDTQYGPCYKFVWDGDETFMSASYYTLDTENEDNNMHADYGYKDSLNRLSLYFVDALYMANTAYCVVYTPASNHKVKNVFSVYSPNVWSWQNAIAHEHGHAIGYWQDQYLYDYGACISCDCGDDTCLSDCLDYTQFLFSDPLGCYNQNQMYFTYPAQLWDWYNITNGQRGYVHEFHYLHSTNFPWY